jgi:glycosyltransferase involved in cell wall biosynthesis
MIVDVTAVIPVRNGAAFIGEALQSAFEQTARPREIIVVDDGSTDGTNLVVRKFPGVIYERQPPSGPAEARNVGARRGSMPFLSFLDADDLWHPAKTEYQLQRMEERPALDIVSGQMLKFRRSPTSGVIPVGTPSDSRLLPALLVRRRAFFRVGPLAAAWAVGETIEWWARAMDCGLLHDSISSVVYLRQVHGQNLGSTIEKPMQEYLKMLHAVISRRRNTSTSNRDRKDE